MSHAEDSGEPSFNERLIEAVRNSRCLYDSKDRQYRSTEYKIKVWNRLVQVLGFDGDARTLYNRWKQLRDKYGKEKKKMKYTGEPTTWQYYKQLAFLDPFMVDRPTAPYSAGSAGKRGKKHSSDSYMDGGHMGMQSNTIMITDPNFSENLINEVRGQPCLFDIRDPKYRHAECRNAAWAEIIKNLNYQGDINSIYKQWKKIRDRYVREKRKIRMSHGSVDGEEPAWDLFGNMAWIDSFLDDRASQVKRKRDSDELSFLGDDDVGFASNSSTKIEPSNDHVNRNSLTNTFNLMSTDDHLQSNQQLHISQQPQQQQQQPHQTQVLLTSTGLGVTSNGVISDSSDGDKAFALSVVSDLRSLSDHAKQMAKLQIQNVLVNASRLPLHVK